MTQSSGVDLFWGALEKLSDLDRVRCKANLLSTRRRYVIQRWGKDASEHFSASLPEGLRRSYESTPMPFTWLPMRRLCDIDYAIWQRFMNGSVDEMRGFGSAVASLDLDMYRAFFRIGTPEFFLSRGGAVLRLYFSEGAITSVVEGRVGRHVLKDIVFPAYMCRDGISGYVDCVTRASGGREVRVAHPTCVHRGDAECTYEVRWS